MAGMWVMRRLWQQEPTEPSEMALLAGQAAAEDVQDFINNRLEIWKG